MKLTPQQLNDLKALWDMPWFKVLLAIEEEERIKLGNLMLEANLEDEKKRKIVSDNQIYIKARKDFLNTYKNYAWNKITEVSV